MTLKGRFTHSYSDFHLDVSFELPSRGCHFIFGPSGSGKSTLLKCLAGLIPEAKGFCSFRGDVWQEQRGHHFLPPHQRRIGFMFQEPSLFPHLNVLDNLLYGFKRAPQNEKLLDFERVIQELELSSLLKHFPGELSGGQSQRVALGRTLLFSPQLLLLDEPFTGLDETSKRKLFLLLSKISREKFLPIYYVTHNVDDVIRLADHLLILKKGKVQNFGPLREMTKALGAPGTDGAGAFALLQARSKTWDERFHLLEVDCENVSLFAPQDESPNLERRQNIYLKIAATDVSLTLEKPQDSSILNVFPVKVEEIKKLNAAECLVTLSLGEQTLYSRLTNKSVDKLQIANGKSVYAQVKSVSLLH